MGPVRGHKSRKKVEHEPGFPTSPLSLPHPLDWWDDFSKRVHGPSSPLKDLSKFESMFKMSWKSFQYISSLVQDLMMAKSSIFIDLSGRNLCLYDQVAVALRRLSSGESLSAVGESLRINQTTVAQITWRFVEAIEEKGLHHIHWPSSEVEMKDVKTKFERIAGLPNCCGAIDTTHIMMCLSSADRSTNVWCDREKNHTMILQAIVGPDLRFHDIVTGWPGSLSDSIVLKSSNFFKLCAEGKRLNGDKIELSQGTKISEYIIGNSGFPLLPWLLTPYTGNKLSHVETEFNKRHMETRMVAQQSLARLKEMWKIIHGVMWRPDKNKLPRIILVCCILHNILIDLEDEVQREISFPDQHDSDYRELVCDSNDDNAAALRGMIALHLSECMQP